MRTVIGLENLKNEFRKAKLSCGDLRGLKNRFSLSEKLGINSFQTYYYSVGGNGGERMELTADCYGLNKQGDIYAYTMKDLIDDIKEEIGEFEINLVCLKWNKQRTDADRKTIETFLYKNK